MLSPFRRLQRANGVGDPTFSRPKPENRPEREQSTPALPLAKRLPIAQEHPLFLPSYACHTTRQNFRPSFLQQHPHQYETKSKRLNATTRGRVPPFPSPHLYRGTAATPPRGSTLRNDDSTPTARRASVSRKCARAAHSRLPRHNLITYGRGGKDDSKASKASKVSMASLNLSTYPPKASIAFKTLSPCQPTQTRRNYQPAREYRFVLEILQPTSRKYVAILRNSIISTIKQVRGSLPPLSAESMP